VKKSPKNNENYNDLPDFLYSYRGIISKHVRRTFNGTAENQSGGFCGSMGIYNNASCG
jgi:hypothetical protein